MKKKIKAIEDMVNALNSQDFFANNSTP